MRAADFRCMNVAVGVLLKRSIILAEDEAGKDYATITARACAKVADVLVRVGRIANDEKLVSSTHLFESFYDQVSVIFRFKARDVEYVALRLYAPLAYYRRIGAALDLCAVCDHGRRRVVFRTVIVLYHARIANYAIGQHGGEPFGKNVVFPAEPVPLLTLMFEAVNV